MILHGHDYLECIRNRLAGSNNNRLAVAFWGRGAMKALGIECPKSPQRNYQIICNLTTGGTNPAEIELLRGKGYDVRHSPRLHAKVFRFADSAVIGSANASANGLGFECNEMNNWSELGVLITDHTQLEKIDV